MLAAGIDVFSTVNVQHLESLNDQVAELTGVRVRETFPDSVLSGADEVVLVDVTPRGADRAAAGGQGLQARAGRGRAQRLLPCREPGGAAGGRAAPGRGGRRGQAAGQAAAAGSRRAPRAGRRRCRRRSASGCSRSSRRRPRRSASCAARGARRSGSAPASTSSPCWRPAASRTATRREQLEALRRLGSLLGAHVLIEEGDDVSEVVARVARERGSTYVLMGSPAARSGLKRFSEPLAEQLLRRLPGVDLRIVADRSKREWTPR